MKKTTTIYTREDTPIEDPYYDFQLLMYKWSIYDTLKDCWNGNILNIDETHSVFNDMNSDILCKVLACSLYQYFSTEVISLSNRIWGKCLVDMGAPKNPKYAVGTPPKALDKFVTFVRKTFHW